MSDVLEDINGWLSQKPEGVDRDMWFASVQVTLARAKAEIENLRGLVGAVSPGQSVADIKEHLRSLKKDKPDASREDLRADRPDSVNHRRKMHALIVGDAIDQLIRLGRYGCVPARWSEMVTESGAAEQTNSRDTKHGR